ncbi:LysR family transcriptional regulator [Loktanella sp. IMCC34160]|uniref:LysR substrate-binding domain-containing protein n=1 Tax=Loktanella sp. IMCC34160 TaxID=2510646 RepID=UPI00101C53CE|nr:LysR substrate-binding domain-containing protein [Loktanella sp. IMCC34160]RYG91786.1 LysR family transcriptional regulator [Loktanella sp. IMCC34160]
MKDGLSHSLPHLLAFEAAARHGSFTRAAEELGVSQPAISQSVRKLEDRIGVALFTRNRKSIALTEAGRILGEDAERAFGRLGNTLRQLRQMGRPDHVTLSVSSAFAHYWMVPRLQSFHAAHPGIDLRMQQTDKDIDPGQEGVSLAVWRGQGDWKGCRSHLIAAEQVWPVASPAWVARNGHPDSIADLAGSALITLEEPFRYRPGWADYFAAFGVSYADRGGGLRLNDYALVLQAAMAGEGVAFGWGHVTQTLVDKGMLVRLGDWCWTSGAGFYLVWSEVADMPPEVAQVRDWIISVAEERA